jgi:hypothetical protein
MYGGLEEGVLKILTNFYWLTNLKMMKITANERIVFACNARSDRHAAGSRPHMLIVMLI